LYKKEAAMVKLTSVKLTEFKFYAPQAKQVSLAGNFNNWNTRAVSARKDSKGNWTAKINLKPGRYEYKFFVDGSWHNDPRCNYCVTNSFGTQNCTVEVK
jgi:1,4-alpha-glucan branching enzyme